MNLKHKIAEVKQRIYLSYDHESHGVILQAGSEVSEIKLDIGMIRNIPNNYLRSEKAKRG